MTGTVRSDLTFDESKKILARELELDEEQLVPEASLFADLCVDSIRMVDMMLRLEDQGITTPLENAWQIETVEDAYRAITS